MNSFAISCLLSAISSFILSIVVIYKNFSLKLNRRWFLTCLVTSIWSFGLLGVVASESYSSAFFFQHILDLGAIFIPVFYFHFTVVLLSLDKQYRKQVIYAYIIGLILAVTSFFPIFKIGMIAGEAGSYFNYWIKPGKFYYIFPLVFSSIMLYSFYLIIKNYNKYTGLLRNQIKYILIAGVIGFIGGATDFFPQLIGTYPVGNYFVFIYVFVVAYAILKYRLMSARLLGSKFFVYFSVAFLVMIFIYALIQFNAIFFPNLLSSTALAVNFLIAIFFSVGIIWIFNKLQMYSDMLFYRGHNPKKIVKDVVLKLNSIIDIDKLIKALFNEFKKVLNTEDVIFFLFSTNRVLKKQAGFKERKINFDDQNIKKIINKKQLLLREELTNEDQSLNLFFDNNTIRIAEPLLIRGDIKGLILLGEKRDKSPYYQEDLDFLEVVSSGLAVSFENAQLYETIDSFNDDLQKKIDDQTKDIKSKNERLEKLLAMRHEFLNISSHQLRTPVSVIKGMVSMMMNDNLPLEQIKEFLGACWQKTLKLEQIVDEILLVSELESDEFKINQTPIDLKEVLQDIYRNNLSSAKDRGLGLSLDVPDNLNKVLANSDYLKIVFKILLSNSLQYTIRGAITIVAKSISRGVEIRISDTGIGIPEEDIDKLFQQFSRAKNATSIYTDGTGLGLYVVKKIIDAHKNANIEIESGGLDRGTTVIIRLAYAE